MTHTGKSGNDKPQSVKRGEPKSGRRVPVLAIAMGVLSGCIVFAAALPLLPWKPTRTTAARGAGVGPGATSPTKKGIGGTTLRARRLDTAPGGIPDDALRQDGGTFYVTGAALGDAFREFEALGFGTRAPGAQGASGLRTPLGGSPLAVTRGQFLDVVSRRPPSSLPTGTGRQGALFYGLTDADVSGRALRTALDEQDLSHDALCEPRRLDPAAFERISIVFHATRANLACVKALLSRPSLAGKGVVGAQSGGSPHGLPLEVTLVALSSGDGYFASRTAPGLVLTLQTWDATWLEQFAAEADGEKGLTPAQKRARRLASVARALTRKSDIVVEVPLSSPGAVPLSFGNFVVVPRALATQGSVRARRVGEALRKSRGREAETLLSSLAPGARALVVSGVGSGLKIDAIN